jgi:hypothetical protein
LENDSLADITVVARRSDDPWENLVAAREDDVDLVVVGGSAAYGTKSLMDAAGRRRTSSVSIGRRRRRVVLTDPADKDLPVEERSRWYLSRALTNLKKVRKDPIAAVAAPFASAKASGAEEGELPDDWLILDLDMPGGPGVDAGPPPAGVVVEFDALPSMVHDRGWLRSLGANPIHDGVLEGLEAFYG